MRITKCLVIVLFVMSAFTGCKHFHNKYTFTYCDTALQGKARAIVSITSAKLTDENESDVSFSSPVTVDNQIAYVDPERPVHYKDNEDEPTADVVNESLIHWEEDGVAPATLHAQHTRYYSSTLYYFGSFIDLQNEDTFQGGTLSDAKWLGDDDFSIDVLYHNGLGQIRHFVMEGKTEMFDASIQPGPKVTCNLDCSGSYSYPVDDETYSGNCKYSCDNGREGSFRIFSNFGEPSPSMNELINEATGGTGSCSIVSDVVPTLPSLP